jgi:hypothetical protein
MVPIRVFYYRKNRKKSSGHQSVDCWLAADFANAIRMRAKSLMIFRKILTDGPEVWNLAQMCGPIRSTKYIFFKV